MNFHNEELNCINKKNILFKISIEPETVKNAIRLKYNTPWPVQILFQDDDVMEKYGFLFSFLLRIKTVQSNLNNLWLCHMKYTKKICL